jgi:succinate dehydrogenase flavin-adding protein (antitoxin of CptAB toxin-antitoxin module)
MRELDQLLGWYLSERYPQSDNATKAAFVSLLDAADPDLWAWLQGMQIPQDPHWRRIVDEIRTRNRL